MSHNHRWKNLKYYTVSKILRTTGLYNSSGCSLRVKDSDVIKPQNRSPCRFLSVYIQTFGNQSKLIVCLLKVPC